ncbi:MAG: hypothetical protein WD988_03440 [Candidatus Curtissbacteria bacterium]
MGHKDLKGLHKGGDGGAVYCLGLVGALIYFISNAQTFGQGALGVLKAFAWPAFLVFELFEYLRL